MNNIYYGDVEIKIPKYVQEIIKNVKCPDATDAYRFRLVGVNPSRPSYGIYADMEKLKKWAERYYAECTVIRYNTTPKNYYVEFKLTDPVAYAFEQLGIK